MRRFTFLLAALAVTLFGGLTASMPAAAQWGCTENCLAPTPPTGDNSNRIATTEFVQKTIGGNLLPAPTRAGDIAYWSGLAWATLPGNNSGTQFFQENASGVPSWASASTTAVTLGTTTTTGGTAGNVLSVTSTGCSGTPPCMTQFSPAPITNSIGSNVTLNNVSNYFDGPSIAQGTTGTWSASGGVTISGGTLGDGIYCKLWDGTTVIDSRTVDVPAASYTISMFLSGSITNPAANIRISCRDPNSTTAIMVANRSGNAKDSSVNAHRIQ